MENIYVQFEGGMVYQQIVGIPIDTNCVPHIADLFLFCYERDFMSYLHKSNQYDLIDMFNDTSRYLETYSWYISNGSSVEQSKYFRQRNVFHWFKYKSKIEKVPRGIRDAESSKDMASSRNLVSTIGALASPKMGDGTRCPEG